MRLGDEQLQPKFIIQPYLLYNQEDMANERNPTEAIFVKEVKMTSEVKRLQQELADLSLTEQLQVANWLIEKVLKQVSKSISGNPLSHANDSQAILPAATTPLLALAGRFTGGPGNTAERAEEILAAEVNSIN